MSESNEKPNCWLAIDQGTSSTRAIAFDAIGDVVAQSRVKIGINRLSRTHVEQDAEEILASVSNVVADVLGRIRSDAAKSWQVLSAGLATQRSSVVAWRKSNGRPLSPVISWQDTRGESALVDLAEHAAEIQRRSGLPLSAHYGATKIAWLLENNDAVVQSRKNEDLCIGPLASFLIYHLVRGNPFFVDHANAGRTQLMSLQDLAWDPWLLERFGIPGDLLPQVVPTEFAYGDLCETFCKSIDQSTGQVDDQTRDPVPFVVAQGDQTAAVYGYGGLPPDMAHVNLGTGGFLLATDGQSLASSASNQLLRAVANSSEATATQILEGTVNGAGAAVKWAMEVLALDTSAPPEIDLWLTRLDEAAADQVPLFLNTVGGLGSPLWRQGGSPSWVSLDGQAAPHQDFEGPALPMGAVLESIVFLLEINRQAMLSLGVPFGKMRASGGLAKSSRLCQRLADVSKCEIIRPESKEATARGIAWLASGCPESWAQIPADRFQPEPNPALHKRFLAFQRLIFATV